jgi:hypothetical protein
LVLVAGCSTGSRSKNADDQAHSSIATSMQPSTRPSRSAAPPTAVTVSEFGFTQLPTDVNGGSYINSAIVLYNPNTTRIATVVFVKVTFYDAAGTVVDEEMPAVGYVGPHDIAALAITTQGRGAVRMTAEARTESWKTVPSGEGGKFTVADVNTVDNAFGGLTTTGTVTSTYPKDVASTFAEGPSLVTALYRDASGKLFGGTSDQWDFVPTATPTRFRIYSSNLAPSVVSTSEVVATPPQPSHLTWDTP